MITPLFKLSQDEDFIYLEAKLKYVKFSDFDYFIENKNFRFSWKPYYLNIYLPENLKNESELNSFKYDIDKQILFCKLEKLNKIYFENLNIISTLLENPALNNSNKNDKKIGTLKIEEINNNNNDDLIEKNKINIKNKEELNNYLFELFNQPEIENLSISEENKLEDYFYGFNNSFIDVFDKRKEELLEICDLNPKKVPIKLRFYAKLENEERDFDIEHYISDLFLLDKYSDFYDENFENLLNLNNEKFIQKISDNNNNNFQYNENELMIIQQVNKINLPTLLNNLNKNNNNFCPFKFYLNIIDILFAYIYDLLMTEYEHSSESAWHINKLSNTLSNFIDFNKNFYTHSSIIDSNILELLIKNVLINNYRRVLIYPLFRNIKICDKIKKNLYEILETGKFGIIKCFLDIRNILEKNEPRYLLNRIYIDPLLKWIEVFSEEKIFVIIKDTINDLNIDKEDLKLNLENYESEYLNN